MSEQIYGFVDENNILREYAVIQENDIETLERLKNDFGYQTAYIMDWSKEVASIGETYWNGTRFVHPSPFLSWIFNEELNDWAAPVPYPEVEEGSDEKYVWDENTISWLLLPPA